MEDLRELEQKMLSYIKMSQEREFLKLLDKFRKECFREGYERGFEQEQINVFESGKYNG